MKTAKYCNAAVENIYKCICDYETAMKSDLKRHKTTCKIQITLRVAAQQIGEKDTQIDILSTENDILKEATLDVKRENTVLNQQLVDLKQQIATLNLELAGLTGQLTVYNKTPVNAKLKTVKHNTIRPFTIETVRADVENGLYTYDHYVTGIPGLAEFISQITKVGDETSYVCTDASRNVFHRLLETRAWKMDNGAKFLESVLDELVDPAGDYYDKVADLLASPDETARELADVIYERTRPIYYAIAKKKSKDRVDVMNALRAEIRRIAAI